jgi:hypothetical protein
VGDVWVCFLFFVASFLLILVAKKQNLGALIATIYAAYAIETKIFFTWMEEPTIRFISLVLISVALFFVFKKFFGEVAVGSNLVSEWFKIVIVSITIVGFVASIVMQWYPKVALSEMFSTFSLEIFRSNEAQLIWMVAPILVIYILNIRR